MGRGDVKLRPCTRQKGYRISEKHRIKADESNETLKYMYYVKNDYCVDGYESEFQLFTYEIVRETNCYYFLINKQRIAKNSNHPKLDITPEGALRKAISRAEKYLQILMQKAGAVHSFLELADIGNRSTDLQDVRGFERFLRTLKPEDPIPPEAFQDIQNFRSEILY